MSAGVQAALALLLVAVAVGWLAVRAWRAAASARTRRAVGCGTRCGCD